MLNRLFTETAFGKPPPFFAKTYAMQLHLIDIESAAPARLAAWIIVALLLFAGFLLAKSHLGDLLIRLYRYFIESNALDL